MNLWYNARHRHRLKLHPLYRTCIPKPKNFPDTHKATSSKTSPRCWHSRRSLVHPSVSHTAKSLLDRILVSKMCLSYNIPYNSQVHVTTKLDYHISNEVWRFPAFLDCPDIAFLPIHNTRAGYVSFLVADTSGPLYIPGLALKCDCMNVL